ncbi:MAG: FAD-binding oxidoreductase [Pseudomonadota bacterium]
MRYAVLGAGLIGSAAARHLSRLGHDVTLIGPSEPDTWAAHDGVFASHYDEGRITRRMDRSPFWSRVAAASLDRYAEIEAASGIAFHAPVGGLYATHDMGEVLRTAGELGTAFDALEPAEATRFGYVLPSHVRVTHEADGAGHISPRKLVAAQQRIALDQGATRLCAVVKSVSGREVVTDQGRHSFDKVLWSAGGFGAPHLKLPLDVQGRTIVYFEVAEGTGAEMPTLILADGERIDIYLLPPIRYPDGRTYLKIGGGPHDRPLLREEDMRAWFKSEGDAEAAKALSSIFHRLAPNVHVLSERRSACVTTYTDDLMPVIGQISDGVFVATAGCGAGAKCSDELGRLGAMAMLGEEVPDISPARFKA